MAADLPAPVERDHTQRAVLADGEHLSGGEHLRAQALRLGRRAPREVGAAEAGREPEVVLDPSTLSRLPARRMALDQERPQTLGRAIDRRRQTGGSAADDDEVIERELRLRTQTDARGDHALGWPHQRLPVLEDQHWKHRIVHLGGGHELTRLRLRDVEPPVGDAVSGHEVAGGVRLGREPVSNDPEPRLGEPCG